VAQAQAGVDAAQVKLQQIQAGARPEAVAAAQANVATAQSKLAAIQQGARPETVAEAKANLDAAQAKLDAILAGPRSENVAQAKANLDSAIAKLNQLKDGPTADQIAASQLQVEQAKDSLASSQANKDAVCGHGDSGGPCQSAQAAAFAAQTAVNVAEQNLKILTDPPTADAVAQAQAAVDVAQQQYDLALKPYVSTDVAQAQAAVDAAQQAYDLAQAPYTNQDVAQAQAALAAAKDQAQLTATPYTDLDVKAAQVTVEQAQAALQLAQTNLSEATVRAPFAGIVNARLLSVGALATPSTPIVTLQSPNLQVQFSIEESRVANIKVGQSVSLTSGAFPGKLFPGQVSSIYPSADPKTHTFTVVVNAQNNSGLQAGMFVGLQVVVASNPAATLVPNAALIQQGTAQQLFVVSAGKAQLRTVTTGISDANNTEIDQGVTPGEEVVTSNQGNLTNGTPVRIQGQGGAGGGTSATGGAARGSGGSARPAARTSPTPAPASGG
jgi:RND family efflux transporter MFP subunit